MCLTVKDDSFVPKTATKPIKVYKLLMPNEKKTKLGFVKKFWTTPVMEAKAKFVFGKCSMGDGEMNGNVYYYGKVHNGKYWEEFNSNNTKCYWEKGVLTPESSYSILNALPDKAKIKSVVIKKGIHAYTSQKYTDGGIHILFEAVIPEGAHYFIGDCGDIVADKMIIYKNGVKDKTIKGIEEDVIK